MKRGLATRYAKSEETRESGGSSYAFDWKKASDDKIAFYKPVVGNNAINIIPYIVKSKNHPLVKSGDMQVGWEDYVMDIWMHKSVGINKTDVICPKKNFAKPCPICDQSDTYRMNGQQKESDILKAKRRVLYNVVDITAPEKGVQVFDASHAYFEKELIDEARAGSDDGNIIDFADMANGKVIAFRASEKSFDGHKFLEFKSFKFRQRAEPVTKAQMEAAISFDDIMKMLSVEEINVVLYGADEVEDEEPPTRMPQEAETAVDDDIPAPAPAQQSKEAPAGSPKCPHEGGVFGKDYDEYDTCARCNVWIQCETAKKDM